jgi:hypothetical protein
MEVDPLQNISHSFTFLTDPSSGLRKTGKYQSSTMAMLIRGYVFMICIEEYPFCALFVFYDLENMDERSKTNLFDPFMRE